jgi:predicted PurR-regulated permease PerM
VEEERNEVRPLAGHRRSWRISLQAWVSLLALGIVLWMMLSAAHLLWELGSILLAAVLVALGIRPVLDVMERRRIPRGASVLVIYLLLLGFLAIVGDLLVPLVSAEVAALESSGPTIAQSISTFLAHTPLLRHLLPSSGSIAQFLAGQFSSVLQPLVGAITGVGNFGVDVLLILILAYLFTRDRGMASGLIRDWAPPRYHPRLEKLLHDLGLRLSRWAWAQPLIVIYFMFTFTVTLTLLKVPFALAIGLFGGLVAIIPFIGGLVAFALAAASALSLNPVLVLWIGVAFFLITELEAHILAPAIYGRATGIRAGAALVVMLLGTKVAGLIGLLYAVPITVIVSTILMEVRESLWNGEASSEDSGVSGRAASD